MDYAEALPLTLGACRQTIRRQKFGWFYVKCSVESNEFGLFFLKTIGSGHGQN